MKVTHSTHLGKDMTTPQPPPDLADAGFQGQQILPGAMEPRLLPGAVEPSNEEVERYFRTYELPWAVE